MAGYASRMMKFVWVYLAVVFGGAFIAAFYFRVQSRGWLSTIVFAGSLLALALYQYRRQQRSQDEPATRRGRSTRGTNEAPGPPADR